MLGQKKVKRKNPSSKSKHNSKTSNSKDVVFKSKFPDLKLPRCHVTEYVFELVESNAWGTRTAFVDEDGNSMTYDELQDNIKSLGSFLTRKDFKQGDVLLVFASNHIYYPIAFHGVASIGGIVSPSNYAYSTSELTHQLNDSGTTHIITTSDKLPIVQEALMECKTLIKGVYLFDSIPDNIINFPVPLVSFKSILVDDGSAFPNVTINTKQDIVCLPYSSGTTGVSKGVMLTHSNLVCNMAQFTNSAHVRFNSYDVLMGVLPFYHIYALSLLLNGGIRQGVKVVVMPRFDPVKFLSLIQKHSISWLHIVPPIVLFLSAHPVIGKFDLSSVHTVVCGAAPLGDAQAAACAKRLNCSVRQGYGMTEMSPVSHISPADNKYYGSGGILVCNTTAKIIDLEGNSCKVNELGELWIKGPQNMKGYLNNKAATKSTIDNEGYLHTGDVAYVNEDGYFFIADRIEELIKYNGSETKISPCELESLLLQHEKIIDAAVIGIPDASSGELAKAFVVVKEGSNVTEEQVQEYIIDQGIEDYKQLRGGVEFIAVIPKSGSGKILRKFLREQSSSIPRVVMNKAKQEEENNYNHHDHHNEIVVVSDHTVTAAKEIKQAIIDKRKKPVRQEAKIISSTTQSHESEKFESKSEPPFEPHSESQSKVRPLVTLGMTPPGEIKFEHEQQEDTEVVPEEMIHMGSEEFDSTQKTMEKAMKGVNLIRKLNGRSNENDLIHQGILHHDQNKLAPTLQATAHKLERNIVSNVISEKLQHRPDTNANEMNHIMPASNVAPSIRAQTHDLEKALIKRDLEKKLTHRPSDKKLEQHGVSLHPETTPAPSLMAAHKQLEREMTKNKVDYLLQGRRGSTDLSKAHIIMDNTHIAPVLQSTVKSLDFNLKRSNLHWEMEARKEEAEFKEQEDIEETKLKEQEEAELKEQEDIEEEEQQYQRNNISSSNSTAANRGYEIESETTFDEMQSEQVPSQEEVFEEEEEEELEEEDVMSQQQEEPINVEDEYMDTYENNENDKEEVEEFSDDEQEEYEHKSINTILSSKQDNKISKQRCIHILLQTVVDLHGAGAISIEEKAVLKNKVVSLDNRIISIAEAFVQDGDFDEFKDSLLQLAK